jgi:hypothetical protein
VRVNPNTVEKSALTLNRKKLDELSVEYHDLRKKILTKLPIDFEESYRKVYEIANPEEYFEDPRVYPELGSIGTLSHKQKKLSRFDVIKNSVLEKLFPKKETPTYLIDNYFLGHFLGYMDKLFQLKDPQAPLKEDFKSWAIRHRYPLDQFTKSEWLIDSGYKKIKMYLRDTLPKLIDSKVKKVSGKNFKEKALSHFYDAPYLDLGNLSKIIPEDCLKNIPIKESLDLMQFFVKNFAGYLSDGYAERLERGGAYFEAHTNVKSDVNRSREYMHSITA